MGNGEFTNTLKQKVGAVINPASGTGVVQTEVLALSGSDVQTALSSVAVRHELTVAAATAGVCTLAPPQYTMQICQLVATTVGAGGTIAIRLLNGAGSTTQTVTMNAAADEVYLIASDDVWKIVSYVSVTVS
jgi:hypothetical protein